MRERLEGLGIEQVPSERGSTREIRAGGDTGWRGQGGSAGQFETGDGVGRRRDRKEREGMRARRTG